MSEKLSGISFDSLKEQIRTSLTKLVHNLAPEEYGCHIVEGFVFLPITKMLSGSAPPTAIIPCVATIKSGFQRGCGGNGQITFYSLLDLIPDLTERVEKDTEETFNSSLVVEGEGVDA